MYFDFVSDIMDVVLLNDIRIWKKQNTEKGLKKRDILGIDNKFY